MVSETLQSQVVLMPLANLIWAIPFIGSVASALAGLVSRRLSAIVGASSLGISALTSIAPAYIFFTSNSPVIISGGSYEWIKIPGPSGAMAISIGSYLDGISLALTLMVAWVSLLIGIYSLSYMRGDPGEHRYWVFFTFFVGSMLLIVMASDIFLLIVGWEGTSLASYALIGHWYRDDDERTWVGDPGRRALGRPMWFTPSHAGVRAIVMTGVPDVGFILGAAAIALWAGTTYIPDLHSRLPEMFGSLASKGILSSFLLLFTLGALAKSAQFPFQEWLVTAMTGPASVSALIHAATMVKAGVYFMLRFVPIFTAAAQAAGQAAVLQLRDYLALVGGVGVFTAFMLATMALVARELKLILAFSTASQIGYMFMAASYAGMLSQPGLGILAGLTHLLSHAVFKAALFLGAGVLIHELGTRYVDHMGWGARVLRITALSMVLASLGLAAIPPFSGFWSKDLVVETALEAGQVSSAALALLTSFLTAAYTLRMLSIMYAGSPEASKPGAWPEKGSEGRLHEDPVAFTPYLILGVGTLVLGLVWGFSYRGLESYLLRGLPTGVGAEIVYSPGLAAVSASISLGGSLTAYYLYTRGRDLIKRVLSMGLARIANSFLYDRWFFNPILYAVFVEGGSSFVRLVGRLVEDSGVDRLYHRAFPKLASGLSRALRGYQPSLINGYLVVMIMGIVVLIILQAVR